MKDVKLGVMMVLAAAMLLFGPAAAASLVAYWPFDEGTGDTTLDIAGGHNGTLRPGGGEPAWVTNTPPTLSPNPFALSFDGSGDFVVATGYKGVIGNAPRTVSAWINTGSTGNQNIISWGQNAGSKKWNFRVQNNDGTVGAIRTEVSGGYIVGDTSVGTSSWRHVAAVVPDIPSVNVTDVRLYVDGVPQGTSASKPKAIDTASSADVRISRDHENRYFNGLIDDVAIWDQALELSHIQELAKGASPLDIVEPPPTYPVKYRIQADDSSWLYVSQNDMMVGTKVHANKTGTQTGSFTMPEGAAQARYAHIQARETTGGQYMVAQFTALPGYVFSESGHQFISTNHDQQTLQGDHQWLASHVEWGEYGYNRADDVDHPWPPVDGRYEPQDEGDAGAPYQPGTRRIWWKYTTDPTNTEAYFSTRLTLEPGIWSVIGTPGSDPGTPAGLMAQIVRVTNNMDRLDGSGANSTAIDALNQGTAYPYHECSEIRAITHADLGGGGQYSSQVGYLAGDYHDNEAESEDYAVRLAAHMYVPTDNYVRTFAVGANDNFYVKIGGTELMRGSENPGSPQVVAFRFPQAGWWELEAVMRNRISNTNFELSSAEGEHSAWNSSFRELGNEDPSDLFEVNQGTITVPTGARSVGAPLYEGAIPAVVDPAQEGFRVQSAFPGGANVTNVDRAINFFDNYANRQAGVVQTHQVMDFRDPQRANAGNFPGGAPFPNNTGANDNDFVTRANGVIYIPAAGTYAFALSSEEGFDLRIGGIQLGRHAGTRGNQGNARSNMLYGYFPAEGLYPVELYHFERGDRSHLELSHGGTDSNRIQSLLVSSRNANTAGFSIDWDGVAYRVEPVARLEAVGLELRGAAYGDLPALGMAIAPERWRLQQATSGYGESRAAGLLGTYVRFSGGGTGDPWNEANIIETATRVDVTSGRLDFGGNYQRGLYPGQSNSEWEDQFGVAWAGYLLAPETGDYTFEEEVDDYSWLWIDGDLILEDSVYNSNAQVTVHLDAGLHEFQYRAREFSGGEDARLRWDPPFGGWEYMPAQYFSQNMYDGAFLAIASGTGRLGDLLSNAHILDYPMDFDTTYRLRLITDVAGLTAIYEDEFRSIPEPGAVVLLGAGLLALSRQRRKRTKQPRSRKLVVLVTAVSLLLLPGTSQAGIVMEADTVALPGTSDGQTTFTSVSFNQSYNASPLVFVLPSTEGSAPCDLRVRNVTRTGFEVAQVEPNNEDGQHAAMTVDYFAVEPGIAMLPDGSILQAGSISTKTTVQRKDPFPNAGGYDSISFLGVCTAPPALLAQVQTVANEAGAPPGDPSTPWLSVAARNVTTGGAQLALERAEVNDGSSVTKEETIGYVAITPRASLFKDDLGDTILYDAFRSADVIKGWDDYSPGGSGKAISFNQSFSSAPLVIGNQATRDGADGGWLRRGAKSAASVNLVIDEDKFKDSERGHIDERASILAFSQPFGLTADEFDTDLPMPSLRYVAAHDTTSDNTWEDSTFVSGFDWSINSNSRTPVSESIAWRITEAYVSPGARGTMPTLETFPGNPSNDSASFEFWFKPDDLTGEEVLWEVGGNQNGTSLAIDGDRLLLTTSSNSAATTKQLSYSGLRTDRLTHAVAVLDLIGNAGSTADPDLFLYVNGDPVATELDVAGFLDWAGGDAMGLGRMGGGSIGGNFAGQLDGFGNFSGQIALFNFYEGPLGPDQAYDLYWSITIPEPTSLLLLGAGLLALARRRRRR